MNPADKRAIEKMVKGKARRDRGLIGPADQADALVEAIRERIAVINKGKVPQPPKIVYVGDDGRKEIDEFTEWMKEAFDDGV